MSDAHIQKELAILAAIERLGLKPNLGNAADLEPLWQAGYDAARNEWHKIETVRDLPTPDKTLYLWRMRADEWKGEVRLQSFSEADQPEGFVKVYAAWVHIPEYQED